MDKNIRRPVRLNCDICGKKNHYKYTREELCKLYKPGGSPIKPCVRNLMLDVVWLNHKLED